MLDGGEVRHDLRPVRRGPLGDRRADGRAGRRAGADGGRGQPRFNVSTRTVDAWRRQGLVARRFIIDGRTKVGFLESSLSRFVAAHQRPGRARHAIPAAHRRRAGRDHPPCPPDGRGRPGPGRMTEIARRIGTQDGALTETVRMTLKAYDRDHPDRRHLPASRPAGRGGQEQIYRLYRRGVSVEVLAKPVRPDPVEHLPRDQRDAGPQILGDKLECMPHPSFDDPKAVAEILGPDARARRRQGPAQEQAPQGAAALPGQPLRGAAAEPRAGDATCSAR